MEAQHIKTLIVDDDRTILALLEEVFQNDPNLDLTTLSDSQQAYELLERERFDLLVTDLMMPKVDGLRLVRRAKETSPETLVVIITGYASLDTTLQAIHAGVYDYITKPFRIEEFRLLVDNVASRIRLRKENTSLQGRLLELERSLELSEEQKRKLEQEVERQHEELDRLNRLLNQTGGVQRPREQNGNRGRLNSYEANLETTGERYEREMNNLEELFASGALSANEFETARQRLKTRI